MKLFCIAYLDALLPAHNALVQALTIAKYDLAIVPLMTRKESVLPWLNVVRATNPLLKLLAYVQVATEDKTHSVSGDVQLQAHPNAWLPGLLYNSRRYADYRSSAWQDSFLSACDATLNTYPVEGLFLDNCAVWGGHVRFQNDGPLQAEALQSVITELRDRHPGIVLIGNTSDKWTHLNGELNENRQATYSIELQSSYRHTTPEMKLAHIYSDDPVAITVAYEQAKSFGAWFGASPSAQNVKWYPCFDS